MKSTTIISALLVISAVNLTLMIPGGFVESRDFSHIAPWILSTFNIFLTTLGLSSLFLSYFIYKHHLWAKWAAFTCGLSYFIVYTIDLAEVFPQSPTPMPLSLLILEILGTLLSIPLMYLTAKKRSELTTNIQNSKPNKILYWLIGLAVLVGLAIIIFATKAAMTEN